ncbi:NUDIX hydrolase [Marinobacter fonticola]|uniref:NUDIX hydrolase n=1 Tax=Marinobacter fonticola TaxID=2603215 RepID=UPI0011E728F3|nr:NUDIX hydrolase [Marinobacter fonticola]
MTWKPHATVAVIAVKDGRFLMVEERSHGRIVFNQPAGHVEQHETILDAARREALEETGWEVEPRHFLGLYTYVAPATDATYYRFCFVADAVKHATEELDPDIIAAHWLTYEELRERQDDLRSPLVLKCIEDYLAGRRFPLSVIVDPAG